MISSFTSSVQDKSGKVAVVIRFGIIGDAVMTTPVIRALKKQGYYVIVYGFVGQGPVYENNPNIDELHLHEGGLGTVVEISIPTGARVVDLQNSCEGRSSVYAGDEPYGCEVHYGCYKIGCARCRVAKQDRVARFGHLNYFEEVLRHAGIEGEDINPNPELFFTAEETKRANEEAREWLDKFVVLWLFSSTSYYKQYPHWYKVAEDFCRKHKEALFYTMGDEACSVMEVYDHPQIIPRCGKWNLRTALAMLNLSDLIIGGESGTMCAAACTDVPKIVLLSNSNAAKLAKYWSNTMALGVSAHCFPCHQIHPTTNSCLTQVVVSEKPRIGIEWPVCQASLSPESLGGAIDFWYKKYKASKKPSLELVQ